MNRGPNVSKILPALARSKGYSQAKLEEATGIAHSTMSRYWSGRGGLGWKNGRKIAAVLGVELSVLGLYEAEELGEQDEGLRLVLAEVSGAVESLKEGQAALLRRLKALEQALEESRLQSATSERGTATRKRKGQR